MATTNAPDFDIDDAEFDALLNSDLTGEQIFNIRDTETQAPPSRPQTQTGDDDDLGLKEVTVVKKRQPIPKLDEDRLLSDLGIPKLRKISKDRLKFKGKGHEYGDIARMLNMYQLWLDDLYPRAKFADGLAIIEKLGHTKRMQMMRKDWIDEGKPRLNAREDDEDDIVVPDEPAQQGADQMEGIQEDTVQSVEEVSRGDGTSGTKETQAPPGFEEPDEDELDALLAADGVPAPAPTTAATKAITAAEVDPFADEMEAMAEMDDIW